MLCQFPSQPVRLPLPAVAASIKIPPNSKPNASPTIHSPSGIVVNIIMLFTLFGYPTDDAGIMHRVSLMVINAMTPGIVTLPGTNDIVQALPCDG